NGEHHSAADRAALSGLQDRSRSPFSDARRARAKALRYHPRILAAASFERRTGAADQTQRRGFIATGFIPTNCIATSCIPTSVTAAGFVAGGRAGVVGPNRDSCAGAVAGV